MFTGKKDGLRQSSTRVREGLPLWFVLLALLLIPASAIPGWSQNGPDQGGERIFIFPFAVYTDKDEGASMVSGLTVALTDNLAAYGVTAISEADRWQTDLSAEQKKRLAIEKGTSAALWGSITLLGEQFSIDASFLATRPDAEVRHIFSQGESLDALARAVANLAGDIVSAISTREIVADIQIRGNTRIEADAIKNVIGTTVGGTFNSKRLSGDLKTIYQMGYFEDVRVSTQETPEGKIVLFHIKERPTVKDIIFKKNTVFEDEELLEELSISRGSIVNTVKIQDNIKQIEQLYKGKNYHNIHVTCNILPEENNQADLEFVIEQGDKFRIQKIKFEGNAVYNDKELRKTIETAEQGFFMWLISSAGDLKMDELQQDITRLTAHYHNNGYINARIGEPEIIVGTAPDSEETEQKKQVELTNSMFSSEEIDYFDHQAEKEAADKGKGIFITFKIEEGKQYKIGGIKLSGDLIEEEQALKDRLTVAENTVFNRSAVRKDLMALNDLYSDQGYYYVDIYPQTDIKDTDLTVDIDYVIKKGDLVYFDEIIISGNTKTRDKVIRRLLDVYEQELYSGQRLKKGIGRLYRLNYFENVTVDTIEKETENKIDLKIEVEEKPTGEFSFGGGYGSMEKFFASASVSQQNLFGRGQILQLQGQVGDRTTQFKLSFTEPWLFDIPLSAGFDLYDWRVDYDTYNMNTRGGGLRFGYPVFDNTRLYLSNTYETNYITEVTAFAPISIRTMEKNSVTSSLSASLVYDTRDRIINPSHGSRHSVTIENAGGPLGGDVAFTKYTTELGRYQPLFWKLIGFLHAEGGYVHENSDGYLPDYKRFYLGGMNSLRGFQWHDISILETDSEGFITEKGGEQFIQFNTELLLPLFDEKIGLVSVLFYDTGNVFDKKEPIDLGGLRESWGFGIRWYSPMGPIRLERGYILDPQTGEDSSGRWEFAIGTAF